MNWQQLTESFSHIIQLNSTQVERPKRWLVKIVQSAYAMIRDLLGGQIQLHAMSLVYTTLLSIVPLLALSVSVLKAFGVHNQLEPVLQNFLEPMGAKGLELSGQIVDFVENMNVAVLGSVGIGLLFYTAISLIQKVEGSFNYIWRVKHRRTVAQQLTHYLSVLMIGPVLLVALVGLVASSMNTSGVVYLLSLDTLGVFSWFSARILPLLIVTAVIAAVYMFVPNTKVQFKSALVGGFFAAVLWKAGGSIFSSFVVGSTKYDAIYSGFAIAMMLMIWLFLSWLILLVGANLSFYWQNPASILRPRDHLNPDSAAQRRLAMGAMVSIAQHFHDDTTGAGLGTLTEELSASPSDLLPLLETLEQHQLIVKIGKDQQSYQPAMDIDAIQLRDILNAVDGKMSAKRDGAQSNIDTLFTELEQQRNQTLNQRSLRDFIRETPRAE